MRGAITATFFLQPRKKNCVGSVLPQAEAERPPRARGTWSGVGRRGTTLPTPPCLRSSASSSYLYLVLVSVPGSVSPGAPAAVFVSSSSPGSPCSFSASEWAALPCPDPEVVQLPVSDLSSGPLPQPHPAPSFLCLRAPYAVRPPCSLGPLPSAAGTPGQQRTVQGGLGAGGT